MAIDYQTPHHEIPAELRDKLEAVMQKTAKETMDRLNTPVPGNPYGGFPGFSMVEEKHKRVAARRAVIDRWNRENPPTSE